MKFYMILFTLIFFVDEANAGSCQPGETRFSWTKMQEQICPAHGDWQTCLSYDFPLAKEANGNSVCKNAKAGKCKYVRRDGQEGIFTYACSQKLYFSRSQGQEFCQATSLPKHAKPLQILGAHNEKSQKCWKQITQVRCCRD